MLNNLQDAMVIIFGLILIAILLKILDVVHKQGSRLRELEQQQKMYEIIEAKEANDGEKSIL